MSSTWLDLQLERRALMDALNRMEEMRFVGMEFFGNRPDDTHDASIDQVDLCEVLVGIVGHRYGSGITEAEYRRARALGLPCFVYFKREDIPGPGLTDGDAALAAKLAAFKQDLLRGHTVKEFTSPEELAANATADLHNWVAARWIALERDAPAGSRAPVAPPEADRTNILRLLERIHHDWIEGVLEASLHHRAWLELGLDWKEDAVEHPWDRIVVAPDRPIQTLSVEDSITGVFDAAQSTLLVLGEPGAGKTTTLLELARELIARARKSAPEPAPAVLALSTWTGAQKDFSDWLAAELGARYQVPKRLARAWLDDARLVLLLDGLDEVPSDRRAACVEAINAFEQEYHPPGLAVTCRVAEYDALSVKLRLRAAICLQPLTPEQIERYFVAAGPGLEHLRRALRDDASLRELARTPLMLSVMTMAWRDAPAESLRGGGAKTVEERRHELLDAYVQTALRRKGIKAGDRLGREVLHVLPWLARQMRARGQTLFAVEQLQPDWLEGARRQFAYFLLARVLAVLVLTLPYYLVPLSVTVKLGVLTAGVAAGIAVAALDFSIFRGGAARIGAPWHRAFVLAGAFGVVPPLGLPAIGHLARGALSPVLIGSLGGLGILIAATLSTLSDVKARDIVPADAIGWSWRQSGRRAAFAIGAWQLFLTMGFLEFLAVKGWSSAANDFGLGSAGFWSGAAIGAVGAGAMVWRGKWRGWLAVGGAIGLVTLGGELGLVFFRRSFPGMPMLSVTLVIGFLAGLFGGLTSGIDETRARRSGAWFWIKVPLLAALTIGSVIGAIAGGTALLLGGRSDLLKVAAIVVTTGGTFGVVAFYRFGGFQGVQHFILRRLLAQSGRLPKNPGPLLEHAVRLNLMQHVGFGYRFMHALLLEHFADGNSESAGREKGP